jgi:hypothetical protein
MGIRGTHNVRRLSKGTAEVAGIVDELEHLSVDSATAPSIVAQAPLEPGWSQLLCAVAATQGPGAARELRDQSDRS